MLSKRLFTIISLIIKGYNIADIGSDHGLIPIYLAEHNYSDYIYASDNKKGPYLRLKSEVESHHYENVIHYALKDGLEDLPSNINFLVIAGMGGDLILRIIEKNINILDKIEYLVLAPHSHEYLIRKKLNELGYFIDEERIVFEGHYYEIMRFKKGNKKYSEDELFFGPILLKNKEEIFLKKYKDQKKALELILLNPNLSEERKSNLNLQIARINKIL